MRTLVLLLAVSTACAQAADPAPSTTTPAATPPPAQPSTPAATSAIGHCAADETAFFDCDVGKGKRLSVCANEGSMQYRFGKIGAPELVFPEQAKDGAQHFTIEERAHVRSSGNVLSFHNADVRYEVTSMIGGGCCSDEEAAANNFVGVYVFKKDTYDILATVGCRGEGTDRLGELIGKVPAPKSE